MLKCVEIYQLAQHCSVAEGDECLGRHCWGNRQSAFAAAGSPSLLYNQTNVTHVGVGPICIRDKFGSQLVWSMQDNLQVKKGVKLAFLEYAFGAEDKICQIVLVISSKNHFTLDDRCCHNPFTKNDYTEDESWCHDNGD